MIRCSFAVPLVFVALGLVAPAVGQSLDLGAACQAFNENQARFRDQHLGRRGTIDLTVSAVQEDGRGTWLVFFPRSSGSGQGQTMMGDLASGIYYARVPASLRRQAVTWLPGDRLQATMSLKSIRAVFKDRISISGNFSNGMGYVGGGTVTVRSLIWTFDLQSATRTRTIASILQEQEAIAARQREKAALERALQEQQQRRIQAERDLLRAATAGDVDELRRLVSLGVRYDVIDKEPVLHKAVASRAYRTTRFLLELPMTNVNATDSRGASALTVAKSVADFSLIDLLKEYGATD